MEENERAVIEEEEEEEEEEEIWSWGAGTEGQLGTGKLQDEHFPVAVNSLAGGGRISLLSCGGAHVIALTSGGRVMAWGRGTCGQLGHGDMVNSLQAKPIRSLESLLVTHVSAGWNHSGFVTDSGCLFTCGDGSFGQLGHGNQNSHSSPVMVSYFASKHVEQIACGMRHSLVLLKGHSGKRVYGFGAGKRGQLGISEDKIGSVSLPQTTVGLEDIQIVRIHANGDHSAALSGDGCLYTWGRGFGTSSNSYSPQRLRSSSSFIQAALGWNHALLLTGDAEVYMLGGKHHGSLSESQKNETVKHSSEDFKEPILSKISRLGGLEVVQIAAGSEHSALVSDSGLVMTWGWGEHGQLGLGSADDQTSPKVVELAHKLPGTRVYCGSGFTFATRTLHPTSQNIQSDIQKRIEL